jgi:hypothetical protein
MGLDQGPASSVFSVFPIYHEMTPSFTLEKLWIAMNRMVKERLVS